MTPGATLLLLLHPLGAGIVNATDPRVLPLRGRADNPRLRASATSPAMRGRADNPHLRGRD